MNPSRITSISTGFLTGNLFSGWSQEEIDTLDVPASVRRFADLWERAIRQQFPDVAEVTVAWQDAEGVLPSPLRTAVSTSNDDCSLEQRLCEEVELLSSHLYESQAWQITR